MRSGTIEVGSGRWHWTLLPQWTGATIVYQHRDRVHDEMRSWTPDAELTQDEARELALDPLERTWMDVDGLKWRLSIELPTGWHREESGNQSASGAGVVWLAFRRGGVRVVAEVNEASRLGEFTHTQLRELLEQAGQSGEESANWEA